MITSHKVLLMASRCVGHVVDSLWTWRNRHVDISSAKPEELRTIPVWLSVLPGLLADAARTRAAASVARAADDVLS